MQGLLITLRLVDTSVDPAFPKRRPGNAPLWPGRLCTSSELPSRAHVCAPRASGDRVCMDIDRLFHFVQEKLRNLCRRYPLERPRPRKDANSELLEQCPPFSPSPIEGDPPAFVRARPKAADLCCAMLCRQLFSAHTPCPAGSTEAPPCLPFETIRARHRGAAESHRSPG